MNAEEIKNIKKLAKKSLEEKWYPLKKGKKDIRPGDDCAFCEDVEKKRKLVPRRAMEDYCSICYISILMPGYCFTIHNRDTDSVIKVLEQLAESGTVKFYGVLSK